MTFSKNMSKTSFRAQVSRKHKMFKRFKKRFAATNNPTEKRFCKTEAGKIVKTLKSFAKKYRNFGFGATSWITKNYNMTAFVSGARGTSRKSRRNTKRTSARKTSRTYGRRTRSWSRRTTRRSTRKNRSNRTNASYYVAW